MATTTSANNPFPGADDATWRGHLAAALSDYTGWPLEVSEDIAAFIVRPKDLLTRTGREYRLRDEVIDKRTFESGAEHHILKVQAHGFMGSPTEYNERVRSSFAAPAAPGATGASLPRLATMTSDEGSPLAVLTTSEAITEDDAARLLDITSKSMQRANGKRPWDMHGDLMLHGQVEPSMHAVLIRQVTTDDGEVFRITDPMAIIGNNRAQARQECFGLTDGTQLGASPAIAGWAPSAPDAKHYYRPAAWAPRLANNLRRAWEKVPAAEGEKGNPRVAAYEAARAAGKLATIPAEFLLAVTRGEEEKPVGQFERVVWEPNRISHRRQPLDYDPLERATAEVRALLSAYVDEGFLNLDEAEWLAGDAPVPGERVEGKNWITNADVRDLRDLLLLQLVFPSDMKQRKIVQQTLGEPAPSSTDAGHVRQRHRLATAAITVGYIRDPWNESINDGLLRANVISASWTPQDKSAATLLRLAGQDDAALTEFINTRGLNWLASHQLIFADRGSIGEGKKTKGLVRRSSSNMRLALTRKPAAAIGLFQEIRRASGKYGQDETIPRQVDNYGHPLPGTAADARWFLEMFPKQARNTGTSTSDPGPTRKKKPTKKEILENHRQKFIDTAVDGLPTAMTALFDAAQELASAARTAAEPGFTEVQEPMTDEIKTAFKAIRKDASVLLTIVEALKEDQPDLSDIDCESVHTIGRADDLGDADEDMETTEEPGDAA